MRFFLTTWSKFVDFYTSAQVLTNLPYYSRFFANTNEFHGRLLWLATDTPKICTLTRIEALHNTGQDFFYLFVSLLILEKTREILSRRH